MNFWKSVEFYKFLFTLISFVPHHCMQPANFKNLIFRPAQCPLPRRSKCHEVPSHSCIKVPLSKESPLPPWSRQQRSCSKLPPSIVWPQLFLASRKENVRFPDSPYFWQIRTSNWMWCLVESVPMELNVGSLPPTSALSSGLSLWPSVLPI